MKGSGMNLILVKFQFAGIHYYKNAPPEVNFLRHQHRHIFHVTAEIEVFHTDRELEFILVKEDLEKEITSLKFQLTDSCEQIAKTIQTYLKVKYPIPFNQRLNGKRIVMGAPMDERVVNVTVLEDNENGAIIREV